MLYSLREPTELSLWLCHDDSNIVLVIIIIIIIIIISLFLSETAVVIFVDTMFIESYAILCMTPFVLL